MIYNDHEESSIVPEEQQQNESSSNQKMSLHRQRQRRRRKRNQPKEQQRKHNNDFIRNSVEEAKMASLSTIQVPVWISEDDESSSSSVHYSSNSNNSSNSLSAFISGEAIASTSTNAAVATTTTAAAAALQSSSLSPLEGVLGPDISACILQHLTVQEIAQTATISKTLYQAAHSSPLWKRKFQARWNWKYFPPRIDWFRAYQQAYRNNDDLWITHWNCVDPTDGLAPGRCCISVDEDDTTEILTTDHQVSTKPMSFCPTCRYHPSASCPHVPHQQDLPFANISTPAQAIAAATHLRLQHQQYFPDDYPQATTAIYSSRHAQRSFAQAATLHRSISTKQYFSNSLHFLSDLLFFQVHEDTLEIEDMKYLFDMQDSHQYHTQHHDASDTALHSWHLCHFTNPDYQRPLVWRISIMRKDCFTVYPSEGYLAPGQSQVVVFGVRPLASLLAYATQQLNAHRESVDSFWANVYTEEAHLPPVPFLIHYHFATTKTTNKNNDNNIRTDEHQRPGNDPPGQAATNRVTTTATITTVFTNQNGSNGQHQNTPWQKSGQPQQPVRIMYLSAHVNVHYTLSEFRRRTMVPFSSHDDHRTVIYTAPQLQEFHPHIFKILERWDLESQDDDACVRAHAYRTEGPCQACGTWWGPRLEELGQAFVVGQLECAQHWHRRHERFEQMGRVLRLLLRQFQQQRRNEMEDENSNIWTERHHQVCVELQKRLIDARAIPWLTVAQRQVLCQWESIADLLCLRYSPIDEEEPCSTQRMDYYMVPWRHAGVYQHVLCTDSVFKDGSLLCSSDFSNQSGVRTFWKEEPKYLEAFAHLTHSPGRFCLGPQEDPNHLRSQPHSRYGRRQRGCVTDMFFDDPVCGLQAALCVVSDPRSLMVHGIWDRVAYPGTLIRRPKLWQLPELDPELSTRLQPVVMSKAQLFTSANKVLYFELQNALDMDALSMVNSWFSTTDSGGSVSLYPLSLRNYIHNIPAPGAGRFPLSKALEQANGGVKIQALDIFDEDALEWPRNDPTQETHEDATTRNDGGRGFQNFHMPVVNGRAGPRILNLLWILSSHLGWTVDDNQGAASVYVDRRILIGAQWLSISLMAAPLFWTLLARYCRWIPATPVDYPLQALPFYVETELRFLSERECGVVSFLVLFSWLCLGRWIERYTSRDFLRAMLEHLPSDDAASHRSLMARFSDSIKLWCQRRWDSVCPLFLQRMVFVPKWNRRSSEDLMKHIAFWRSNQDSNASYESDFRPISGGGFIFSDNPEGQIHLGEVSWSTKIFLFIVVSLASFSAGSPHFFLNVLTVFSGSISLGLSMSLQSMETGRAGVTVSATGSIVETLSLVTIVIFGFLVGQLVGSSGGVLFLAEFVVTSISLVLGGAGTISASAMESWGTFFCLAVTSFWGYLFGRVSIMEGIKQKRSGFSSVMLCLSLFVLAVLWLLASLVWKWEHAIELVIDRPEIQRNFRKWVWSDDLYQKHKLQ